MFNQMLEILQRRLRSYAWAGVIGAGLTLAACGGGGGGGGGTAAVADASTGMAMISITDADGDFTSYSVDVQALSLKRDDGTVIELLPRKQTVDFAQLVNVSELLTVAAVPKGRYVSASITLDYTKAQVAVEVAGKSTTATVVNATNLNPGVVTLDLQLDVQNQLSISPGRISGLALDFNLAASNQVDLTKTPPVVQVLPTVVASIVPAESKDLRVRGTLASVNTGASSYVVNVRPFREAATNSGQMTVLTTATTSYELNGTSYTGPAGLTALAALPAGTITAAFGSLQVADHSFTASRVLAGSSLEGPNEDGLMGTVIARSGNTFTVHGATLERRDGDDRFMLADVKVTVGANTGVSRAGEATTGLTQQAISVGQRVTVFGTATTDSTGVTTLDASAGRVRLEITSVAGLFLSSGAGVTTVKLQSIDGRDPTTLKFAGTGASTAQDADPARYDVKTGTLPVGGIAANAATRYLGFVTPFGAAPPDFEARTLIDFTNTASELRIEWKDHGTATPFISATATGIVVDLANTSLGVAHAVRTGAQVTDLKTLTGNTRIVPGTATVQIFAIRAEGSDRAVKTYTVFADFVTDLNTRLTTGGKKLQGLWARGKLDSVANSFTATELAVELE
jgi:hypothetical protein